MINDPKSTKDAPPEAPTRNIPPASETAPFATFATLFHKGIERLAEVQKNTLDIIALQTTEAIGAWKHAAAVPPSAPGMLVLDLANQGIEKVAQAQKGMIDLVVKQSAKAVDMGKQRRDSASKLTTGVADLVSETAESTVAAHKIMLDFAAEQNKVVAAALKRQAGIAGSNPATAAVETMQRNMDVAIETQKELMDAATKPLKAAAPKPAAA
jgi:hypothetical protein